MKAIVILGVGFIGSAGAFCLLNWVRTPPAKSGPLQSNQGTAAQRDDSNTQDRTSELQEQVRQLASEVAVLRRKVAAGPVAPPTTASLEESAPPVDIHSPEGKAKAKREHEERIADVEAEFRSEGHDPRWSQPTEASIRDAVSAVNLTHGSLQTVECQTKTCRVELTVKDPVAFSQEIPNLVGRLSQQLHGSAMDFIDNPGGGHTGVLYLFR